MSKQRDTRQLSLELIDHKPSCLQAATAPKTNQTPIALSAVRANRSREDLLSQLRQSGLVSWKKMKVNS